MKNLFTFVLLCAAVTGYGQEVAQFKKDAVIKYYKEIGRAPVDEDIEVDTLNINNLINSMKIDSSLNKMTLEAVNVSDGISNYLIERIRQNKKSNVTPPENKKMLLTEAALNTFFASEVSSYVTSSKDLTLQKAYAVLNTSDKILFLGGSFDFRKDETKAVRHLLTVGFKGKVSDDFTTIYKNGELQNDLGFNLKFHCIGNGSIYFNNDQEKKISEYRDKMIEKLLEETVYDDSTDKKSTDEKGIDFFKKIAKEEVDYLRKFKLYTLSTSHWFSFEAYIPVSPRQYEVINDITTTNIKKENFLPWYITAGLTKYWKYSNDKSFYLSGFGNVKNSNNIEQEILKKYTYTILSDSNTALTEKTKTIYGGNFQEFVIPSVNAEFVSFLVLKGTFGVSSSIERTFGKYESTNWKLGIPVSLKDKEGKPSVNFELVWKEVSKEHFVGINVGFTFGKFIQ